MQNYHNIFFYMYKIYNNIESFYYILYSDYNLFIIFKIFKQKERMRETKKRDKEIQDVLEVIKFFLHIYYSRLHHLYDHSVILFENSRIFQMMPSRIAL